MKPKDLMLRIAKELGELSEKCYGKAQMFTEGHYPRWAVRSISVGELAREVLHLHRLLMYVGDKDDNQEVSDSAIATNSEMLRIADQLYRVANNADRIGTNSVPEYRGAPNQKELAIKGLADDMSRLLGEAKDKLSDSSPLCVLAEQRLPPDDYEIKSHGEIVVTCGWFCP